MTVYLGADHAGYAYKERLKKFLTSRGLDWIDLGAFSEKPSDYPKTAIAVAQKVVKNKALGILVCGTGTGMAMAANKVKGARAAFAFDTYSARKSKEDNDSNILTLRGRAFPYSRIEPIVKTWLAAGFSGMVRHKRRLAQLSSYERGKR